MGVFQRLLWGGRGAKELAGLEFGSVAVIPATICQAPAGDLIGIRWRRDDLGLHFTCGMAFTTLYLIDSAACITRAMAGCVVVTGSHGGDSAAGFARIGERPHSWITYGMLAARVSNGRHFPRDASNVLSFSALPRAFQKTVVIVAKRF